MGRLHEEILPQDLQLVLILPQDLALVVIWSNEMSGKTYSNNIYAIHWIMQDDVKMCLILVQQGYF